MVGGGLAPNLKTKLRPWAYPGSPGQRTVKRLRVCVCPSVHDADVPVECDVDGHHELRGIGDHHPRHAQLGLQRRGV